MKIERMKRWVIVMLLCGLCHIAAFAYGYDQNTQSKDWGYQPVYNSGSSMPTYQFRTTSVYMNTLGEPSSLRLRNIGPRRDPAAPFSWDDDDNPIGEVPDPVPVGDTPWFLMLLLAAGYIAIYSRKRAK